VGRDKRSDRSVLLNRSVTWTAGIAYADRWDRSPRPGLLGGGEVRCRLLITTGILCGLIDSTIDDRWLRALTVDKGTDARLANGTATRTLPVEPR
jgi:hypothetical protein